MVPGLRLRVLNISRNPAVKHGTLLDLTRIQTELTSLDVSSCNRAFMDCPLGIHTLIYIPFVSFFSTREENHRLIRMSLKGSTKLTSI